MTRSFASPALRCRAGRRPAAPPFARLARLLLLLAGVVLVLQLLGAARHHHDPAHAAADCAACVLDAQPPAPPGPPLPSAAAHHVLVLHPAAVRWALIPTLRAAGVLTPPAHAPPASILRTALSNA